MLAAVHNAQCKCCCHNSKSRCSCHLIAWLDTRPDSALHTRLEVESTLKSTARINQTRPYASCTTCLADISSTTTILARPANIDCVNLLPSTMNRTCCPLGKWKGGPRWQWSWQLLCLTNVHSVIMRILRAVHKKKHLHVNSNSNWIAEWASSPCRWFWLWLWLYAYCGQPKQSGLQCKKLVAIKILSLATWKCNRNELY